MNIFMKILLLFFGNTLKIAICGLFANQGVTSEYMAGAEYIPEPGRKNVAFDKEIHALDINKSILLFLLDKIGKESQGRMKYWWQTKDRRADYIALTAVGGNWILGPAADGTLTVAASNAWLFAEGDILQIPSIDKCVNIYVDSVVQATGVITCYTVNGNLNLGDFATSLGNVLLIGNSFDVGSGMGTIKNQQPVENYNYIQIVQTPCGITTTAKHLDYNGINEFDEQKKEEGINHAFKLEKLMFFGQRHMRTQGRMNATYAQYFTGGIQCFLSTNVVNVNGNLTQAAFVDWLNDITRYAKEPIIFSGEIIYEALWQWADGKLELVQSTDLLGMTITKYKTPYGKIVNVIAHRELLCDDYAGVAFGIDLQDIKQEYLNGLDTHIALGIQQPDYKQQIDEYRTWIGLKYTNEKRHGLMYGVTGITT